MRIGDITRSNSGTEPEICSRPASHQHADGGMRVPRDRAALCMYKVRELRTYWPSEPVTFWPSLLPALSCRTKAMTRQVGVVLYVLAMIAVVVSVDIFFFRHHFTGRLIANVGIVLVFAAFGFLIFRGLGRR